MHMRRTFVIGIIGLALIGLGAEASRACSCLPPPPPKPAMEAAAAVFHGKVLKIDKGEHMWTVRLKVVRTWKGVDAAEVTVTTASNSAMCGYGFVEGQEYLVYCHGRGEGLRTNICTRTRGIANAGDDLKELGEGKAPAAAGAAAH